MKILFYVTLLVIYKDASAFTSARTSTSVSWKKIPTNLNAIPSWDDLSSMPNFNFKDEQPIAVNGASYSSRPAISKGKPTLYRERHVWCPYRTVREFGSESMDLVREVDKIFPSDPIQLYPDDITKN